MLFPAIEERTTVQVFQCCSLLRSRRFRRCQARLLPAYTDSNRRLHRLQLQPALLFGLIPGFDRCEVIVVEYRRELDVGESILATLVVA
jgi:hypothetical protein